jgi:hypothetical protein
MPLMTHNQPIITESRVEAYVASMLRLLGWLFAAILRLNPIGRSARLKRVLARAERTVEIILFLKAAALYGPPPQRKTHPRFAASGFRRIQGRRLRLFFRNAGVRARKASPLTRVIALIQALTRPQRAVAYFLKHITKGLHFGRVVATAPPACSFTRDALAAAQCALPDTS